MHLVILPNWNSLDSVRRAHSDLEAAGLIFFALLVIMEALAHNSEGERRKHLFDSIGIWFFAVAIFCEIGGYWYGQRNDELSQQIISSLDAKAREAAGNASTALANSTDAENKSSDAVSKAGKAQDKADTANRTSDQAKRKAEAVGKQADELTQRAAELNEGQRKLAELQSTAERKESVLAKTVDEYAMELRGRAIPDDHSRPIERCSSH